MDREVRHSASRLFDALAVVLAVTGLGGCAGANPGSSPAVTPAATGTSTSPGGDAEPPGSDYWVYVANESSDIVSVVRFGPDGASIEKAIEVGFIPADLDGAHGVSVSPDGRYWYLTTAHGTPWGRLWKYKTGSDSLVAGIELGLFPATIGVSPDGATAYVVNFNLHGDPVPSTVSVVNTDPLEQIGRIVTCVMPHGSRVAPSGEYAYSVCMHDDELVEISASRLVVTRRMALTPGGEGLKAAGEAAQEPMTELHRDGPRCKPTWAEPGVNGRYVYVACNGHQEVLEIAVDDLTVTRRFSTGKAPYNLEVTADGRLLIASNKGAQSISVFDLEGGLELARIPTSRPITHGVVASPDSRYAFVSNEAVGATFSTVDVFDLRSLRRVAEVEVEHQAGGIDFWKAE
jgi:DNA-binding beta-propeller fold protein YncE